MKNAEVDLINTVIRRHGTNQYGDPIFRVVFSDNQVESRKGTYTDYAGDIFIRTVTEVREVPKYPNLKGKWILERWAPGELSYHPDLITMKNGVYICVYAFQDKDGNYLPPLLKVAEILIYHLLNPRTRGEALAQDKIIDAETEEQEISVIEEELIVQSDEAATKDPKSSRESISSGYTKESI